MRSVVFNCIAGPMKGQRIRLDDGPVHIFGRYHKAGVSMAADPAASHLHFLIDTSEERVRIIDLGSTNGLVVNETYVGGKLGAHVRDFVELKSGDTVLAGSCLFRLMVENAETAMIRDLPAGASGPLRLEALPVGAPDRLTAVIYKDGGGEGAPEAGGAGGTVAPNRGADDALPEIDGYSIIEKIGGGGKGVIYRAVKNDSGASAAIKMMLFNRSPVKRQRSFEMFRREIQMTRQLTHSHIIRHLGDGVSQGAPYLALEYVEGGNLDELIHQQPAGRLDLPQAVPLFLQLLEAVSHMHGQSLVHRDIKPKNILLDLRRGGSRAVKLSDMGLSCRFSNDSAGDFLPLVCEGGTPAYMPPEQLTDLTRALPQSDVFSSAATFYQMLTGSLLYEFSDREQNDVILEGNIEPIHHRRPDLPLGIANVISKALSYNPENRYANAQEMLDAFRLALS